LLSDNVKAAIQRRGGQVASLAMDATKPFDTRTLDLAPGGERASSAFVGALAGPVLGLIFIWARIGPAGLIWWQGKGDKTILTPLGRIICSIIFAVGGIGGALCGCALDAKYRPRNTAKLKTDPQQEHLWDRELDG
jgi:hypothetical protein